MLCVFGIPHNKHANVCTVHTHKHALLHTISPIKITFNLKIFSRYKNIHFFRRSPYTAPKMEEKTLSICRNWMRRKKEMNEQTNNFIRIRSPIFFKHKCSFDRSFVWLLVSHKFYFCHYFFHASLKGAIKFVLFGGTHIYSHTTHTVQHWKFQHVLHICYCALKYIIYNTKHIWACLRWGRMCIYLVGGSTV